MRSVVLDTETTGMPVTDGHRIIEIGCVELEGRRLTGRGGVAGQSVTTGPPSSAHATMPPFMS